MAFNKALIVDDSKLARVTLKKKLESFGLVVIAAESAAEAYQLIGQEMPDIVFMDHLMPEVDGFEACVHLRQQGVMTPIIMCTGKEHDGYLEEALDIGANYILGKPPGDEALAEVLAMEFAAPAVPEQYIPSATVSEEDESDVMTVDDFDLSDLDQMLESVGEDNIPMLEEEFVAATPVVEALLDVNESADDGDEELDDWMQSLLDDDVDTATDLDSVEIISRADDTDNIVDDESSYFIDEVDEDEVELQVVAEVESAVESVTESTEMDTDWLDEGAETSTVVIEAAAIEGLVNARVLEGQAAVLAEVQSLIEPLKQQMAQAGAANNEYAAGVERQEVEMLVQSAIDASRSAIMQDVAQEMRRLQGQLDNTPISVAAEQDERELLIRLEEILHPRLIELKSSLLVDVQNKIQADKESGFDELLDLRLNTLLAERMAGFENRINSLEDKISTMTLMPVDGIPVLDDAQAKDRYRLSEKVSRHLEQLIEENAQFAKRIAQIRQMSLVAGAAGAAGLIIAALSFLLG